MLWLIILGLILFFLFQWERNTRPTGVKGKIAKCANEIHKFGEETDSYILKEASEPFVKKYRGILLREEIEKILKDVFIWASSSWEEFWRPRPPRPPSRPMSRPTSQLSSQLRAKYKIVKKKFDG